MDHLMLKTSLRFGVIAFAVAATGGDDLPNPRPGLWQESGTATHYDPLGKVVAIDGITVRHTSSQHCISAAEAAAFYIDPLPSCQFVLHREGAGVFRATALCPGGGDRLDVVSRVTPDTIDMRKTDTGHDGRRVESVSHSRRIGDCAAGAAPVRADASAPRPAAPPSTWFSADDYPAAAARARAGGRVSYEVDVDVNGAVIGCRIAISSGNADLDGVTCSILRQRARFLPGRSGKYSDHINWIAAPR